MNLQQKTSSFVLHRDTDGPSCPYFAQELLKMLNLGGQNGHFGTFWTKMQVTRIARVAVRHQGEPGDHTAPHGGRSTSHSQGTAHGPRSYKVAYSGPVKKSTGPFFHFGTPTATPPSFRAPAAKVPKVAKCTFWWRHCTLLMRTWGRARYLMNDRYLPHHVVQYGRPARHY